MFCIKCGQQIEDTAAFCTRCGNKTAGESAQQPLHTPAPQYAPQPHAGYAQYAPPRRKNPGLIVGLSIGAVAAIVLLIVLLLHGAQVSLTENQIADDIKNSDIIFKGDIQFDVSNVDIDRQQIDDRESTVYCTIGLISDMYKYDIKYILYYSYYEHGGWFLEGYEEINRDEWKLSPVGGLSETNIIQRVRTRIDDYNNSVVRIIDQFIDLDNGIHRVDCEAEKEYTTSTCTFKISMEFRFSDNGWETHTFDIIDSTVELNEQAFLGTWYGEAEAGNNQFAVKIYSIDSSSVEVSAWSTMYFDGPSTHPITIHQTVYYEYNDRTGQINIPIEIDAEGSNVSYGYKRFYFMVSAGGEGYYATVWGDKYGQGDVYKSDKDIDTATVLDFTRYQEGVTLREFLE